MALTAILKAITSSTSSVFDNPAFVTQLSLEKPQVGDLLLLNSGFCNRKDVKTSQSHLRLCATVPTPGSAHDVPDVVADFPMRSDFKVLRKSAKNLPDRLPLIEAIETQLRDFGRLPLILTGQVIDDLVDTEPLTYQSLGVLELNPTLPVGVHVVSDTVRVRDLYDVEAMARSVSAALGQSPTDPDPALSLALSKAVDELSLRSSARLVLQGKAATSGPSVLESVNAVLAEHVAQYQSAFKRCGGDPTVNHEAYNEMLRISYNFAADAGDLTRLILSLADLKPLVSWGTLGAQWRLNRALHLLPRTDPKVKPSLAAYATTVGDARNSAFHHLFPFRKTLQLDLESGDLATPSLRLFSEFSRRKENQLLFRDKELVDVLTGFTRARERRIPPSFWDRNRELMAATIGLFEATGSTLLAVSGSL